MKTRQSRPGEERLFLAKAKEFAEAMVALRESHPNAAAVMAVNCVISACDALTAAKLGRTGADLHGKIVDLLGEISEVDSKRRSQVRDVLAIKKKAEYGSRKVTGDEADDTVKRAERFLDWVERAV